jgi:hypothetical protein
MWEMKPGPAPQKVLSTANGTRAGHEAEHHASYMMIFIVTCKFERNCQQVVYTDIQGWMR